MASVENWGEKHLYFLHPFTLLFSGKKLREKAVFLSSILFSPYGLSSRNRRLHLPIGEKGELLSAHTLSWQLTTGGRYQYNNDGSAQPNQRVCSALKQPNCHASVLVRG